MNYTIILCLTRSIQFGTLNHVLFDQSLTTYREPKHFIVQKKEIMNKVCLFRQVSLSVEH
jgi:hypothetical protein